MQYFSNLFDKVLYLFRKGPLPIIRSTNTVYTAIHVSSLGCLLADANRTNMHCCVYSVDTPDDGQWTCPKEVEYFIK